MQESHFVKTMNSETTHYAVSCFFLTLRLKHSSQQTCSGDSDTVRNLGSVIYQYLAKSIAQKLLTLTLNYSPQHSLQDISALHESRVSS
jgi:hypothetical protein